jgi:hypothetical protein
LSLGDATHALDLTKGPGATRRGVELAAAYVDLATERMVARGNLAGMYGAVREEAG